MAEAVDMRPDEEVLRCDVVIAGGGLVGMSLAAALAGARVATTVIDAQEEQAVLDARHDGRSSAIAFGARQALAATGVWPGMAAAAQPIWHIRVSDGDGTGRVSRLFLDYDAGELAPPGARWRAWPPPPPAEGSGAHGFRSAELDMAGVAPLGYIVENRATREALLGRLAVLPTLRHLRPARVAGVERTPGKATVVLTDGRRVEARLVVAADGGESRLRLEAGIAVMRLAYPQTAIVCTVTHTLPHEGVAHEHFLPSGPFAMLPMVPDPATGAYRSSVVWTERNDLAPAMLRLDEARFSFEMQRRFGDSLGTLRLVGGRWSYPLRLIHAERYVDHRLALIGDAAHVVHPIAGQGFNLGLKDVAALAEIVVDAMRLGLDIGSLAVLERYERWRRLDTVMLIAATDGINRLFSNDIGPLRLLRDLGLAAVDRLPPLKRLFMRDAMGTLGELPRLIRGEAL
ncbi:MAG: UbiH/UbiF/VisC/COQ6 family ubiquinone biosynthesis hydroxylase [Rhodospirillaceae bacterium]|nr:UbiH/UbiF/VisC/COQ6 family ubiquinone biosynthesis hydroxylase [Rhodospirillaceae bacterium]